MLNFWETHLAATEFFKNNPLSTRSWLRVPGMQQGQSQGLCSTTDTERFVNVECRCSTYPENLGPCAEFESGSNGRCVFCDHTRKCHYSA